MDQTEPVMGVNREVGWLERVERELEDQHFREEIRLRARIAALEQENADLRAALEAQFPVIEETDDDTPDLMDLT